MAEETTDSMAKVPLPCMRTHSNSPPWSDGRAPPSASSRRRIAATVSRNSRSREPSSRIMAAFTVVLVVSGPGVKSSLPVGMLEVLVFIAVAEIDAGGEVAPDRRHFGGRLPDVLSADVGGIHHDILDRVRRNLARV